MVAHEWLGQVLAGHEVADASFGGTKGEKDLESLGVPEGACEHQHLGVGAQLDHRLGHNRATFPEGNPTVKSVVVSGFPVSPAPV